MVRHLKISQTSWQNLNSPNVELLSLSFCMIPTLMYSFEVVSSKLQNTLGGRLYHNGIEYPMKNRVKGISLSEMLRTFISIEAGCF